MKTTKERKRLNALLTKASKIKKEKKAKGFTLVELIVVIAIIGILAVVLVPNMLSYIDKAALSTANDTAAKISEQAGLIAVDLESRGAASIDGVYTQDEIFAASLGTDTVGYQLQKAVPDLKSSDEFELKIENGKVIYVVWADADDTDEIGTWPKLTNLDIIEGKKLSSDKTKIVSYAQTGTYPAS